MIAVRAASLPLFAVLCILPAQAQTAAPSPEARRDEIAKVQEMLADPDPLMRLTNMEAIVKSGDALKLLVALRTAFTGDDKDLRGLALRAYLATRKEVTFEVVPPSDAQDAYDATRTDPSAARSFRQKYLYFIYLTDAASRFQLSFPDYAFAQDRGTVFSNQRNGSFTITGDRMATMLPLHNWGNCYVDFAPTNRQAFEGTLACPRWPKLAIKAPDL